MPVVNIPNVGRVTFPDSMSQDDITTAIERDILKREQSDRIVRRPETGGAAGAVGPVIGAGPTLGQGVPSPFTIGQPPSGLEEAQASVESQRARAQAASVGQPTIEIGAQPATVPRFGKPGTFVGEASGMVAGLGEWALNNPEEFLASIYPPTQAAVALRYAPSIVAQAGKDAVSAAKGDTGALGRLAALSAMVLGPKGVEAARAKYLAEGPPGMPLPNVDAMARAAFRDQPALALHETLLPRSAEAVKQIERTPDASSQPKTTTEDGNLRTQPERVMEQMPVEEGGSGVQPQTEGRLPETPPGTLTPAIQVQGKTFTGEDHLAAYENAKASGQPDTSGAQEGFVNDKGGFLTRKEAAQQTGLPTVTEPGKLHSSDLESKPPPSSSETVPQTEAPAAAAVSEAEAPGVAAPEAPPATSKPTPLEPLTQASSAGTEGETQAQRGTETPAAQVERPGAPKSDVLGIVPPGIAKGVALVQDVGKRLYNLREGFRQIWQSQPNRRLMEQAMDGAETLAGTEGRQVRRSLELDGSLLDRQAAYAIVEANETYAKLGQFLTQVRGKNLDATRAVRHAMANYARLKPLADKVRAILDAQIDMEKQVGLDPEYREAYVPHILDLDLLMGTKRPVVLSGGRGGLSTAFKKGRAFDTIFDAIEAGYNPKSIDVAKVVEHRVRAGQQMINRKMWADSLRTAVDPVDNRPIVTDLERKSRGQGKPGWEQAPMGYVPKEILPGTGGKLALDLPWIIRMDER